MKTILIVIAGMGDLPDPITKRDTPLVSASIPSLDLLAQRGDLYVISTIQSGEDISHKNAFLSLMGYDLQRGEPEIEELMEFGLAGNQPLTVFQSLRPFVIPGFSGHGVAITPSAWARGVAKCAFLKPLDIYSPGSSEADIVATMAELACRAIIEHEFVLLYVDSPLKASLRGDFDTKVSALETIDRFLINPIADFVWKSELYINLAVTTDLVTPWHRKRPTMMNVPAVFYFNNHDREGDPDDVFTEVNAMLNRHLSDSPSDFMRFLCNFNIKEEDENIDELPF